MTRRQCRIRMDVFEIIEYNNKGKIFEAVQLLQIWTLKHHTSFQIEYKWRSACLKQKKKIFELRNGIGWVLNSNIHIVSF